MLKKVYDMFSAADNCGDADTGLTKEEFLTSINVEKLKEALAPAAPILKVDWLLELEGTQQLSAEKVFTMLDKNCSKHITMREFVDLLKLKKVDLVVDKV
jgi:hypothetical protein